MRTLLAGLFPRQVIADCPRCRAAARFMPSLPALRCAAGCIGDNGLPLIWSSLRQWLRLGARR